ncbi:winged helix-turn-helix domain-containing protein [Sandarakinorhabdus sp.]|uniref:winged helix-turn-helix domain-containing protein n=1 Tax=Sandarakinorhabdus sp. TaxID=1916663 RepID=UPI00286D92DC|nr:winged helix-turn-helix domain-containing protein [Sandarakinorhabdus sp.]
MRLAVLANDTALGVLIAERLKATVRNCVVFNDAANLRRALRRETFDLLLLDEDFALAVDSYLPSASRLALDTTTIVYFASEFAASLPEDDRLVLPSQFEKLERIIASMFDRDSGANGDVEVFGKLRFDLTSMIVTVDGRPVELTAKEFGLALLLMRNRGRPLSRAHIMESVWGRVPDTASRTLDAHISQIRKRLNLRPESGFRLTSVYGFGYLLEVTKPGPAHQAQEIQTPAP